MYTVAKVKPAKLPGSLLTMGNDLIPVLSSFQPKDYEIETSTEFEDSYSDGCSFLDEEIVDQNIEVVKEDSSVCSETCGGSMHKGSSITDLEDKDGIAVDSGCFENDDNGRSNFSDGGDDVTEAANENLVSFTGVDLVANVGYYLSFIPDS